MKFRYSNDLLRPPPNMMVNNLWKLTDRFSHDGPNIRYQCLVFNVDGVSVPTLVTCYDMTRGAYRMYH